MRRDINDECAGRWEQILINVIGIPEQHFSGRHCDCIICGDEKRHARWEPKKEFWICTKCGSTQPMQAAMHWTGESFKNVAKLIRNERPDKMEPIKQQSEDFEKNKYITEKIHKGLKKMRGECLGSLYLMQRGLKVLPEKDCYFHPAVSYFEDGIEKGLYPALVSYFRDKSGEIVLSHHTFLTADGQKADIRDNKKTKLKLQENTLGSAIKLFEPIQGVLAVAEGIETALAVHQAEGLPVWSAGNAGRLAAMEFPGDLKELWIYADVDPGFSGQKAAYTLAKSASNKKKYPLMTKIRVVMQQFSGEVNIITDDGNKLDFLDALLLQIGGAQSET